MFEPSVVSWRVSASPARPPNLASAVPALEATDVSTEPPPPPPPPPRVASLEPRSSAARLQRTALRCSLKKEPTLNGTRGDFHGAENPDERRHSGGLSSGFHFPKPAWTLALQSRRRNSSFLPLPRFDSRRGEARVAYGPPACSFGRQQVSFWPGGGPGGGGGRGGGGGGRPRASERAKKSVQFHFRPSAAPVAANGLKEAPAEASGGRSSGREHACQWGEPNSPLGPRSISILDTLIIMHQGEG